jgi:hypothetical protein
MHGNFQYLECNHLAPASSRGVHFEIQIPIAKSTTLTRKIAVQRAMMTIGDIMMSGLAV